MKHFIFITLAAVLASGCIVKETRHDLYLEPDGGLTWTVLETGIRAEGGTPEDRREEENRYLDEYLAGGHSISEALALLGPERIDGRLLRAERPFSVWTEARYGSLDGLGRRFLELLEVPGEASLELENGRGRFEFTCRVRPACPGDGDGSSAAEAAKTLGALADNLDCYRLVLTDGRFTGASGFRLLENGRVAVMEAVDEQKLEAAGGILHLSLDWDAAAASSRN